MKELVGHCRACGREVYCRDGFLDGVVQEDSSVLCFACDSVTPRAGDQNES
ncbi:hypothetical protein [Paenibacillus sp. 1011MAR3C5]|uniref:hypothetical protein n=1 Tax=Paenibacillus sp. 1011MAR3C5 TaxID=1675787 RepID=UPI00160166DA|nr:hypothetical protein [Paenibacillus sp. 1011MAR3C5]